jgi:hypothetical protein
MAKSATAGWWLAPRRFNTGHCSGTNVAGTLVRDYRMPPSPLASDEMTASAAPALGPFYCPADSGHKDRDGTKSCATQRKNCRARTGALHLSSSLWEAARRATISGQHTSGSPTKPRTTSLQNGRIKSMRTSWLKTRQPADSPHRPMKPRSHETIFGGRRSCPETKTPYPPRRSNNGVRKEPGSKMMVDAVTALCVFFSISIFLAHAVDASRAAR